MKRDINWLKDLQQSYRVTFNGSPQGKDVLVNLERHCHFNHTTFDPDPYVTAFNEGQRSVLLHIKTMLDADYEELKKFLDAGT